MASEADTTIDVGEAEQADDEPGVPPFGFVHDAVARRLVVLKLANDFGMRNGYGEDFVLGLAQRYLEWAEAVL